MYILYIRCIDSVHKVYIQYTFVDMYIKGWYNYMQRVSVRFAKVLLSTESYEYIFYFLTKITHKFTISIISDRDCLKRLRWAVGSVEV